MRILIALLLLPLLISPAWASAASRAIRPASYTCRAKAPAPPARPEAYSFEIKSIDLAGNSFTAYSGALVNTYHVRPDTQITINGQEMHFKDLEPEMRAKITLAEPGVAAAVEAIGETAANSATTAAGTNPDVKTNGILSKTLEGTKWTWETGDTLAAYIEFHPGGALTYTPIPGSQHYNWTWVSKGGFDIQVTTKKQKSSLLKFDSEITRFTRQISDPSDPGRVTGHLVKPDAPQPR